MSVVVVEPLVQVISTFFENALDSVFTFFKVFPYIINVEAVKGNANIGCSEIQ